MPHADPVIVDIDDAPTRTPPAFLRELTALAKYPILALGPRHAPIELYAREGGVRFRLHVETHGGPGVGLATLSDGDVLIFAAAVLTQRLNLGQDRRCEIVARPGTILRALGKPADGPHYALLIGAFSRLTATHVRIEAVAETQGRPAQAQAPTFALAMPPGTPYFPLIDRLIRPPKGGRAPWRFTTSEWFVRQIERKRMLTVDLDLLRRRGLERRLASWIRAYTGARSTWRFPLRHVPGLAGALNASRKVQYDLRALVARQPFQGVRLIIDEAGQELRIEREGGLFPAPEPTDDAGASPLLAPAPGASPRDTDGDLVWL